MQSRKVVTRSSRKFKGYFPSKKLNRMVEWESLLERDAIVLFEFSSGVVDYQEQPEVIYYAMDGKTQRYYPDFEVTLKNGQPVHVEVKPQDKLNSPKLKAKFQAIAERYSTHPAQFLILTEQTIQQEPRYSNLRRVDFVSHFPLEDEEAAIFLKHFSSLNYDISVEALAAQIGSKNVLCLIAQRYLTCDLDLDLRSPMNFVRLYGEADHEAVLF